LFLQDLDEFVQKESVEAAIEIIKSGWQKIPARASRAGNLAL
jgi:hypothetical protein